MNGVIFWIKSMVFLQKSSEVCNTPISKETSREALNVSPARRVLSECVKFLREAGKGFKKNPPRTA